MKAVVLILALITTAANASPTVVYRWTDEQGVTHISDTEPEHVREKTVTEYPESKVPPARYTPQRYSEPAPRANNHQGSPSKGSIHYLPTNRPGASLAECIRVKRMAVRQRKTDRADTWLWKNCRAYSNELRKIEQEAF